MSTIVTTRDYTSKCLNVPLWIKFKHNYVLQIAIYASIAPFLALMHFVRKKRCGRCTISSRIIIIREGQLILPTRLRSLLAGQQKALYHQNYLPHK